MGCGIGYAQRAGGLIQYDQSPLRGFFDRV